MTGGSRGTVAWEDSAATWIEYGNPHSTMGQGDLEDYAVDFLVSGKETFDWLDASNFAEIEPYDDAGNPQAFQSGP